MSIRRAVLPLVLFALCSVLTGRAQEQGVYIHQGDTMRYTYVPMQADSLPAAKPEKKRSFLRKIVDYFEKSTEDRTFVKKIDFTFAGGPSYSKNTNFGIGLLASGLYRVDRTDSVTQPSNISIFGSVSVTGVYALGVTGNNIYDRNRQRVDYTVSFSSSPRSLWGVGYDAGAYNKESTYVEKHYLVEGRYVYGVLPHLFVGGMLSFEHTTGKKFTNLDYLYDQNKRYTTTGLGLILEYDSRDFIPNPYKGVYVSLQETLYPKGLGNAGRSLWRTSFTANYYQKVWRGGVIAADFYAEFNSDGTPWPMLARLGGSYRMRGYYEGRYTDNNMLTMQVELRQRIWRRIGGVVWGGAGNVFSEHRKFDWSHTLPNYGIGLRWELKKRVNVRIDYGFGRKTSGFMLNINEAF